MSRSLALGTAQFGLSYGVANTSGQVKFGEIAEILELARCAGIDTLDTAIAYGESETRLGMFGMQDWQIVSKLPPIPSDCLDLTGWVRANVCGSLSRLRIPKLKAMLLHRSEDLLSPQGDVLYRALIDCKDSGYFGQIGISVYSPQEIDAIRQRYSFDIVQAPLNVVDRRLVSSGMLSQLAKWGVEVHVRSAFLQGLLIMNAADRPSRFMNWQSLWSSWSEWLEEQCLTPQQACLGYALSQSGISRVVVGVDSANHLREIISSSQVGLVEPPASLINEDPQLINPLSWLTS